MMNIEEKNNLIDYLVGNRSMKPYGVTMTFLSSEEMNLIGSRIFYDRSFTHENIQADHALDRFKRKVEEDFRLALGKLCVATMGTSNTTRKGSRVKHPLCFYAFHVGKKQKREAAIEEKPAFKFVSPLHIHGIILVPEAINDNFKTFLGEDTIHKFCRLGQGSKIETCYKIDGWMSYVNRDLLSPLPREDMHPRGFSLKPSEFINI
jgi:hypothetical protein